MTQSAPKMWGRKPLTLDALMAWTRKEPGGCVVWTRSLNASGYGRVMGEGSRWMVHRLVWTLLNGPIPDGADIDHLCFNPACVNPDHLQPLSVMENRARHAASMFPVCSNGHELSGDNLRFATHRNGKTVRRCRACERQGAQKDVAKRLQAGLATEGPTRTHCKRGHEFTPENTYTQPSRPWSHTCRECKRLRR